MSKGRLVIISGPSGSGKSTIIRALMAQSPGAFFSVSATTRKIRTGEQDGVDYHFVTRERFEELIRQDGLLEWAEYVDNYYGTPAAPVLEKLAEGRDVFLDIETQGAKQVLAKYPDAVTVFVCTPTFQVLEERLRARGTNTEEDIRKRLRKGRAECENAGWYTYLIINDVRERAAAEAAAIMTAERCKDKTPLLRLKGE
jgi:guanylate kinase